MTRDLEMTPLAPSSSGMHVPRDVFVDLEPSVIDEVGNRSTGDLYPVTAPSPIPHAFLVSQHTWHQCLGHPGECAFVSFLLTLLSSNKGSLSFLHAVRLATREALPLIKSKYSSFTTLLFKMNLKGFCKIQEQLRMQAGHQRGLCVVPPAYWNVVVDRISLSSSNDACANATSQFLTFP
ncbi:hypothetical protein Tco_1258027 [Tanacetum coccineum]